MALELRTLITENSGCVSFSIFDTTGTYHAFNNPGGWGAPNPATTDVTSARLEVTLLGYSATATTYDITASFADLFTANGLTVTSTQLFNSATFQDGVYEIKYVVVISGTTYYSYINYQSFYCSIKCCVRKMSLNIKLPLENKQLIEDVFLANVLLQAAEWAGCCGESNNAATIIEYLTKICAGCGKAQISAFDTTTSSSTSSGCCS